MDSRPHVEALYSVQCTVYINDWSDLPINNWFLNPVRFLCVIPRAEDEEHPALLFRKRI